MKQYTVKFLDSESFDNLPYSKVADSLGVADQKAGIAYVRDTASPMDVFTTMHELEHLKGNDLEEHETPGEDGVYYKSSGSIMQTLAPFANFIPGIGPAVSIGMGAGGTALNARDQAKAQKSAMGQQQNMMGQFNPGAATQQAPANPATSQAGGASGGMDMSMGNSDGNMIRQLLRERQSGNYSGRA